MAYVYKLPSGKWRAQVDTRGVRDSESFPSKREATEWGAAREAEIRAAGAGQYPRKTLGDAIDRYLLEVAGLRREERLRLERLKRDHPGLAGKILSEITTPDMAAWRDARLRDLVPRTQRTVAPATVLREVNSLSAIFGLARAEWKWCGPSPLTDMRKPADGAPRDRRTAPSEVRAICRWLGYRTGQMPATKSQEVALLYLMALRTAMRAGELVQLNDDIVDLNRRVVRVRHKMQYLTGRKRDIPLTRQAIRLMRVVSGRGKWWTVSAQTLSTLWRRARAGCGIEGLTFHDARAEALTRLSKKVPVEVLARISGHQDLRTLVEHYYRESAEDIARRL